MPLALQASLLRVLQTNQIVRVGATAPQDVNVRVVCATHRALTDVVREGRFREDLYYRLNVLTVDVPALREREDVVFLAERLLARIAPRLDQETPTLTNNDRSVLRRHAWPGNVRELENVLTRFIVTGRIVLPALSSASGSNSANPNGSLKERLQSQADEEIRAALERARGNKRLAAESLGISRAHLYRRIKSKDPV